MSQQRYRLLLPALGVLLTLGAGGVLWYLSEQLHKHELHNATGDAAAFSHSVTQFRNFYSAEIVPRAKDAGLSITHDYKNQPHALPLPATFTLDFGEYLSNQQQGFAVEMFSAHPFPWRQANRKLDQFQQQALTAIESAPDQPYVKVDILNGVKTLRYATADRMKANCVACHNSYPGSPKTDWKVGDVRGVVEIRRPLSSSALETGLQHAAYISAALILSTILLLWLTLRGLHRTALASENSNRQLRDTQRKLSQQLFALDQHAIVSMADRAGNITYANDKFCDISGYNREELIGKNHRVVNSGYHPEIFFSQLWQTVMAGKVWTGEICNRRKDGSYYWVNATIVPFVDESGQPYQYIGIRTDISERKRTEQALQLAKDAAEAANRAKSDFLANMSHEIRTPMNGIIGMSELALDTRNETERDEYIGIVKSSAEALLAILNDILDFSKIEAGKLEIEQVPFQLRQTLIDALRPLTLRAHEKGLEILCEIGDDVPDQVQGDPVRLRQILINLVGNAIKFTERGQIVLRLQTLNHEAKSSVLQFAVCDSGIGIAAEKLATIFEAFSQADNSITRKYGGTGLGLSITQQLVRLMGGEMQVSSEIGVGSTFSFSLPLQHCAFDPPHHDLSQLRGKRVLIVDDNAVNREIFLRQLQRWQLQPDAVAHATLAQIWLQQHPMPDLVLLDVHMPDMDGFSLAAWIRAQASFQSIPILMLSSGPLGNDSERCRELNLQGHYTKPVTDHDLQQAMLRALSHQTHTTTVVKSTLVPAPIPVETDSGLQVLLVEDNPVNQKLATLILQKWGHQVSLAENGQQAVEMIAAAHDSYQLVLMDMQMPVMDGIAATGEIRRYEQQHGLTALPIIAMTANAMESDREHCLAAGMNDYLSKPIKQAELAEKLQHHVPSAR